MNNSIQPWWRWLGCGLVSAQLFWLGFALLPSPSARADSVINSVHNLSASGPGSIKSSSENNPCIFCHTVHKAIGSSPLWNHTLSSVSNYVVYTSTRLQSLGITVPQPSGSSRLCLSCHDGTVALGSISSKTVVVEPGNVAAGGGLVGSIAEPFDLSGYGNGNGALQAQDGGTTVTYTGNLNLVADAGVGSVSGVPFTIGGTISGAGRLVKVSGNTVTLLRPCFKIENA